MSLVGMFPGLNINRRAIPAAKNPMDRSTVVSIYPKEILETKPTIQPGRFYIPRGSYTNPSVLIVGSSSWWRDIDDDQPMLEIPVSSVQVADSIVKDYCNGVLECNMSDLMPGLFFVPGCAFDKTNAPNETETINWIKTTHKPMLEQALVRQKNWYMALVKMADTLWARSNGNPLAISDDMRLAAKELGIEHKEWIKDFTAVDLVRCTACGAMRNPLYPVCQVCKAIADPVKAKELNLQFAS